MTFLINAYLAIGILFLIAIIFKTNFSPVLKLSATLLFAVTVIWIEMPHWLELWLWKMKMM